MAKMRERDGDHFERLLRHRNSLAHHRNVVKKSPKITQTELERISEYLKNPTVTGIWIGRGNSLINEGICKTIKSQLEEKISDKKPTELRSLVRNVKVNFDKNDIAQIFESLDRFSLIFHLFNILIKSEKNSESLSEYINDVGSYDSVIFQLIDLEKIKTEYSKAYEYFKKEIYFDNFIPSIYRNKIFQIKEGYLILFDTEIDEEFIFEDDNEVFFEEFTNFEMISLDPEPIEKMITFLNMLQRIKDETMYPIFSPEEEVFAPYFVFLEQTYSSLIKNRNIQQKIKKSIDEYNEDNYSQCINTIGLIFEEYLMEIYETCFRDTCPKGKTLGELFELLEKRINEKFQEAPITKPDPRPIQKTLNNIANDIPESQKITETLKILRDFIIFTTNNSQYLESKINYITKKPLGKSIFPRDIKENINELIRNRNAVSHKTQIPIGNYEALRSIYCFMTVFVWWINSKKTINWKQSSNEILQNLIDKNT